MFSYDTWGGSWGNSWGGSWGVSIGPDSPPDSPPDSSPDPILLGGGPGEDRHYHYHPSYSQLREEAQRLELKRIDDELALAEKLKQGARDAYADARTAREAKKAAKKAAALEASLQAQINALRIERERLIRLIEEEAIIALLLCSPFN